MKCSMTGFNEEEFYELIQSYCDTLQRNKSKLYSCYKDRTMDMSINFPIRCDGVPTMEVNFSKMTYKNDKKIINIEGEDKNEN